MSYADYGHYGQRYPYEGNVLLCTIENQMYPVTVDALTTVFSPYGGVQKIAIFEKQGTWQALVQYGDNQSAYNAKSVLEGHAIYDGGYNKLRILYSKHTDLNVKVNNDKSWDYTAAQYHSLQGDGQYGNDESSVASHVSGLHRGKVFIRTFLGVDYERSHEDIARAAAAAVSGVVQHQPVAPPGVNPYAPPQAPGVAVHPTYAPYVAAPPHYGQPPIAPIQSYAAPQPPPPQHTVAVVPSQQIQTYSNPAVEESPESVRPPGQASEDPAPGQEQET